MKTSCEPQVNGFFDQRPRWAGAIEPRCTSSQTGLLTAGRLFPSPIGNLDPVDDWGRAGEGASSAILLRMVRWCIRLTRLTLVCEVIWYRLVQLQVRQNLKKRLFGLAARNRLSLSLPLSFSSSSYFLSFSKQKWFPTAKPQNRLRDITLFLVGLLKYFLCRVSIIYFDGQSCNSTHMNA